MLSSVGPPSFRHWRHGALAGFTHDDEIASDRGAHEPTRTAPPRPVSLGLALDEEAAEPADETEGVFTLVVEDAGA